MRGTAKALLVFGLLAPLADTAAGQAMLEHATAAAGGSVAGVAGKSVSGGIDAIFRKVNKVTETAAQPAVAAPARTPAAAAGPAEAAVVARRPIAGKPAPKPEPAAAATEPPPPTSPAPPEPEPLTSAELAKIEAGLSRQDVLARLGRPSARITIPGGDGLVEIFQYASRGERLGSLRLVDGVVSDVRVEAR